jgi:hypothetical protein
MKSLLLLTGALLSFYVSTFAQRNCGTMLYQQMLEQEQPEIIQQRISIEQHTQNFIASDDGSDRSVITIPVVVHVLWNTSAQNISDAQILSQLAVLNEDFRKMNADASSIPSAFATLAADSEIEFCLATLDPNGNPTTGITRTQTSVAEFPYGPEIKFTAQGGKDAWPRSQYLNIWIGNIEGTILGYAQFPGGSASTDGVVIDYLYFGTMGTATYPFNKGRTATHEVGHWLNLYHIWGDDDGACSESDLVDDTPNQAGENYGCPAFPNVSCSNGPNGDMFMNYMDYVDDDCMKMFSTGQRNRMRALFGAGGFRESLLSSPACGVPPACPSPTALTATNIVTTGATLSWGTVGEASSGYQYVISTSNTAPSGAGTVHATTSVTVNNLTANTTYYLFVRANCGVDGFSTWSGPYTFSTPCSTIATLPFTETFESNSSTRSCWNMSDYVSGPQVSWTYNNGAISSSISSAHGGNTNVLFFYEDMNQSAVTRLVSPTFNLSTVAAAEVSFWYASQEWESDQDELRVYYKTTSGGSWTLIPGAVYTSNVTSWTEVVLNLPTPSETYAIAFEGLTNYGHGVVIDDVQIRAVNNCIAPTALTATNNGANSATLSWTASPSATNGYQYVFSTSNTEPVGSGTVVGGTSTNVSSLTSGTTYYLFVRSNCGNGVFSPWAGPVSYFVPLINDNCSGAIALTPSPTCSPVSGTTIGGTQSIPAITCGGYQGNANDDVWYSFTALSPTHTINVTGSGTFDAVVDVRSGNCNGSNIACRDATTTGTEQVPLTGLTVNATYYIRVYGYGSTTNNGNFTICVTMPTLPTWYFDNDNDGHYVSTQQAYASPGAGWNTTGGTSGDCDDNNASIWQSASFYTDSDGDGYTNGTQTVCYGNSIPAGYSATTLGNDCNDNNATVWQSASLYVDNDGDGYNAGTQTICYGSSIPSGYSATTIGSDCDDNNASVWQSTSLYVDNDGDGYNAGMQTVCYGNSIPAGYSVTTIGSDCNDNNVSVWQSAALYVDNDGDGYTNGTQTVCYGNSIPTGYSATTLGNDCNDNNVNINPSATEVCNGVDDNCDGVTDSGCGTNTAPANDMLKNNNPAFNSSNQVYPNCIELTGTTTGASPSIQTGETDVWYQFNARSNGVSIRVRSTTIDAKIYLFSANDLSQALDIEDLIEGTGIEVLNYNSLIEGQNYKVAVVAKNNADGNFQICVQHMRKPNCKNITNLSLCETYGSTETDAFSTTYVFTDEEQVEHIATTSSSSIALSNNSLGLRYSSSYDVQMTANYRMYNGLNEVEYIYVPGDATCPFATSAHKPVVVSASQRCTTGAQLTRNVYLSSQASGSNCTHTGYRVEFTPVANCNGDNPNEAQAFTKTISLPNHAISLNYAYNHLPEASNPNLGYWSVRWRPRFAGYEGTYSTPYVISVKKTTGAAPAMELDNTQEPIAAVSKMSDISANVYPNPNNGELVNLNITGLTGTDVYVRIMDSMGRGVFTNHYTAEGSLNTIINFTQPLAQGLYMVEFRDGDRVAIQRMMVSK